MFRIAQKHTHLPQVASWEREAGASPAPLHTQLGCWEKAWVKYAHTVPRAPGLHTQDAQHTLAVATQNCPGRGLLSTQGPNEPPDVFIHPSQCKSALGGSQGWVRSAHEGQHWRRDMRGRQLGASSRQRISYSEERKSQTESGRAGGLLLSLGLWTPFPEVLQPPCTPQITRGSSLLKRVMTS